METDNKKAVYVSLVIVNLVVGYLLNRAFIYLANAAGIRNSVPWLSGLSLSLLLAVLIAGGLCLYLINAPQVVSYLTEVVGEFKKLVWPTRKETIAGSAAVVVLVLITAAILAAFDWMFSKAIVFLISQ